MQRLLLCCLAFIAPGLGQGQYEPLARNAFLEEHVQQCFEFWSISKPSFRFHPDFRPYLSATYATAHDSVIPFRGYPFRNLFFGHTFNERPEARNWVNVQLHPLVDAELGYDALLRRPVTSGMGGMHVKVNVNNDFTFAGTLAAGNSLLPFFADTVVQAQRVLPEFGQAYKGRQAGYHFFDYQGYVSYSPAKSRVFNFQVGRDKHFIGNGYRSVLLSDFAPAYPFVRINANVWHLQYNVWYAWMYDISQARQVQRHFRNKYGTFHYLSWNITRGISLGVFENVVWRGTDTNQARTFDVNYLNPLVFYRPVEYSLGSPDNSFLGFNFSAVAFRTVRFYAQLGLDEFYLREIRARRGWWANKQAWQLGLRWINAFRFKGMEVQMEYNQARPFTYSHGVPDQNYGHYGYPLAHPLGANFSEFIGSAGLRRHRWEIFLRGMLVVQGRDSLYSETSNVGQNIFLSYTTRQAEYGHYTGQGVRHTMLQSHLRLCYFVLPAMNLRVELGYIQRSMRSTGFSLENPWFYVGLKSGIWNAYRDF